jgi:hypothetical protein
VKLWTLANVERLVADGYVRLVVTDRVPTQVVGDRVSVR